MKWSDLRLRWDRTGPPRLPAAAVDAAILGATVLLQALSLVLTPPASWPPALFLAVAQTVPLLWRRRWPLAVLVVLFAANSAEALVHVHFGGYLVTVPATIYSIADRTGRIRWLVLGLGAAYAAVSGVRGALAAHDIQGITAAFPGVVVCAAFLMGENARTRRAYLAELHARLARQDEDRAADRRQAADEERARIARELHDVVTHHVSAIAVQAETNRAVRPVGPDAAVLASIAETARTTLDELARLLGVMRGSGRAPAPREPEPSLAAIGELAERARAAGLDVHVRVTGPPRPLPAALELSAYRIIQEAVTNAGKHAPGARVDVSLSYEPGALRICVVNDGGGRPRAPGRTSAGEGRGLIGMRERVALFGGSLESGPVAGGFQVSATLPARDGV